MKKFIAWAIGLVVVFLFSYLFIFTTPSNDRNWSLDQKVLPDITINDNLITIKNIRNFSYTSTENYTPDYYDKTFNLDQIEKVYYVVEPFSGIKGSAHTFLSFEFADNNFVSISAEIRREEGEQFSPLLGLLNQYELTYIIADERDVIGLRTNYRKDNVYLYPIKADKKIVREVFLDMVNRADKLSKQPEFYNTIFNNCTTNIVKHINNIAGQNLSFNWRFILPATSDELAYDLGLIDTDLPFENTREKYWINDRAQKYASDPNFSIKIRR